MKNENTQEMSKSAAKRAARKQEVILAKKKMAREKAVGYLVSAIVLLIIAAIVVAFAMRASVDVKASDNYSACIDSKGYIMNTGAADVDVPQYKNLVVPLADVEYTDDELNEEIESLKESYKALNDDASLNIKDGDEVNIDYVGSIDGVAFDGGSAEGYNLVIGSGSFIEGFEDQLIGKSVQSTFDINVTFPEEYGNEELNGKDAVFTVTVNGIMVVPEFNDEFVQTYLSDVAQTVDEYKAYEKAHKMDLNLTSWIQNYLEENAIVNRYDKKYLKNLKSTIKNDDILSYNYMNQMYEAYLGYSYYNSFSDYVGMTEYEYDKSLVDKAKISYRNNIVYQAIMETEGKSVDVEGYKQRLHEEGYDDTEYDAEVENFGQNFVFQMALKENATELVKSMVTIE